MHEPLLQSTTIYTRRLGAAIVFLFHAILLERVQNHLDVKNVGHKSFCGRFII